MKLLIIEDEASLQELMTATLKKEGYVVENAMDYNEAIDKLGAYSYDCVLLDLNLPGGNGLDILEHIKRRCSKLNVIIISARDSIDDKVRGLELGADDYIAKPFRPRELVSRIKNILRLTGGASSVIWLGNIMVDIDKGIVSKNGKDLHLSALEYRLLLVFLGNRGIVLSRTQLLDAIWDIAGDFVNDNTLTVYIKRLREKLEEDPQNPEIIKTVRGLGYKVEM